MVAATAVGIGVALLWSACDGQLTVSDGNNSLEVRYPSNGIVEYWRREESGTGGGLPLATLLQEANALLDEECRRPNDAGGHETCITVRQLREKLSGFDAIDRALGENLDGDARAAQESLYRDLKEKIQHHWFQMLLAAGGPDTDMSLKVSLLERAEHVASLHPQYFPKDSSDPATDIDAVWKQLSTSAVKLYEECLQLTEAVVSPIEGLTRSQSSKVEDGVGLLAWKMALLNEYRTAFSPAQPTAEEGVPLEPDPEPEPQDAGTRSKSAYELVSAQMSQLCDRFGENCDLRDLPVVTQEDRETFARTVETLCYAEASRRRRLAAEARDEWMVDSVMKLHSAARSQRRGHGNSQRRRTGRGHGNLLHCLSAHLSLTLSPIQILTRCRPS
eukprot:COSAG02_NODE_7962_length_2771_cov_1.490269_3_plen_389_part_00